MKFLKNTMIKFFGSKHIERIPRTYEALVHREGIPNHIQETQYLGDTICSLVKQLKKDKVDPNQVKIFELYNDERQKQIPTSLYSTVESNWFPKLELCKISSRYGEQENYPTCAFQDRYGKVCGPYYDLIPI